MTASTPQPASDTTLLRTPVYQSPGVGRARAELLAKLGIRTVVDLLFCFPRDYEDLTKLSKVCQLEQGKKASVVCTVREVELRDLGQGRNILGVLVHDGVEYMRGVWFNQPFLANRFRDGQRCVFTGVAKKRGGRWEMSHPQYVFHIEEAQPEGLLPVYPLTEGIGQRQMRSMVDAAVKQYGVALEEAFPDELRRRFELTKLDEALLAIHRPTTREELARARRRFVFQELFVMQLALARRRHLLSRDRAPTLPISAKIRARIVRLFPFDLTESQQAVCDELAADMVKENPMNRLLQGDVGSGKTVVAAFAMLLAVAHGYQATLMAPTEVLARQHARSLKQMLRQSSVTIEMMIGSDTPKQREALLQRIADGEVDLLIGTQAIAHAVQAGKINMKKLGLVIIDEQHKFGVRQRSMMKQAGAAPHYLVMTATPIPRTITMSLFGDLEVSQLHGSPHQRTLHTYQGTTETRAKWWEFFAKKLNEGRQGYVIAPLVDGGETGEQNSIRDGTTHSGGSVRSVEEIYEELANGVLEEFRIDLLHGRMTSREKDDAMLRFTRGETQVLVATSIVEVGIDVPNASVMTIESANRFGLAQLHQLRGRIGRGVHPGYVCIFDESAEPDERLEIFCRCSDGFELAEEDFRIRGPGEILGTKQHGLPPLRIADLLNDQDTVEEARGEASWLIQQDPELIAPDHAKLARLMKAQYGEVLDLGDVG
jgi:ATP-dependent DNA helicase RecG